MALGSGGAMGLTQIGIIKVLKENNIPIDFVAGSSIGSIVGAYYAIFESIEGLEDEVKKLSKKDVLKLIDLVSIGGGLVGGKRAMEYLTKLIGDKSFSDTKIPLKIVATDIEDGKEFLFDSGKLSDAIRASISIPGVFTPMKLNGKYYLDGGIVNPTPIDVVKSMGADIVIAIDHTMSDYKKLENPTILEALKRSFEIVRTETAKLKMGQLDKNVILISVKKNNLKDTYNFYDKSFIANGEKIAREQLEKIKETINNWKHSK